MGLFSKCLIIISVLFVGARPVYGDSESNKFKDYSISIGIYDSALLPEYTDRPPIPIIWKAFQKATIGSILFFDKLIYHTESFYSLDVGLSLGVWHSRVDHLQTFSLYLKNHFWLFDTKYVNSSILYSVAGATYITKRHFDRASLGEHFLFEDFFGIDFGFFEKKDIFLDILMMHYSNGNLFKFNDGFDIPLVVSIGFHF